MNSAQYEELCRLYVADLFGLCVDAVQSRLEPGPRRPGLPVSKHQIDLYWETGNEGVSYVNIANAKWRTEDPVDRPEVMLLEKVREKLAAHKAMLITNTGFTRGARDEAEDYGIALHVVRPASHLAALHGVKRDAFSDALQAMRTPEAPALYSSNVVHRAADSPAQVPNRVPGSAFSGQVARPAEPGIHRMHSDGRTRAVPARNDKSIPRHGRSDPHRDEPNR